MIFIELTVRVYKTLFGVILLSLFESTSVSWFCFSELTGDWNSTIIASIIQRVNIKILNSKVFVFLQLSDRFESHTELGPECDTAC